MEATLLRIDGGTPGPDEMPDAHYDSCFVCAAYGQASPVYCRGLCPGHYRRLLKKRPLTKPLQAKAREVKPRAVCSTEGCLTTAIARGLCGKHYARFLRHGDAEYERTWKHGGGYGYFDKACRCEECVSWYTAALARNAEHKLQHYRLNAQERIRQSVAQTKVRNDSSRTSAHCHGNVWTGPELEIAAREDLSVPEIAQMLGRTILAVAAQRRAIRADPRKQRLAGVELP